MNDLALFAACVVAIAIGIALGWWSAKPTEPRNTRDDPAEVPPV